MSDRRNQPAPQPGRNASMAPGHAAIVFSVEVTSDRTGVSVARIRSYERQGLIQADRDASGAIRFSESELEEIRRIERIVDDLGVNLAGVEVILHMRRRLVALQNELARFREQDR